MRDPNLLLMVILILPVVIIAFMLHQLGVQRQSVQRSMIAMGRQQEALQVHRQILESAEENLSLQREIRGLLERVAVAAERRV